MSGQASGQEQFCLAPNQCRILKYDPQTDKVTTAVQITFDLTAKKNPTCNIFVQDEIIDAVAGSKTEFWKSYWFQLMDLSKGQMREYSLPHFETQDETKDNWKYPPIKLVPVEEQRIDVNQPLDYPYKIFVEKMSAMHVNFPEMAELHKWEFQNQKRFWKTYDNFLKQQSNKRLKLEQSKWKTSETRSFSSPSSPPIGGGVQTTQREAPEKIAKRWLNKEGKEE